MPTITATYLGDLRVECTHCATGTTLVTDAPLDNQGKGEAFSPTDLCATALGACALTIMGIYARNHGVDSTGTTVEKTCISVPSPLWATKPISRAKTVLPSHGGREKSCSISAPEPATMTVMAKNIISA